METERKKILEEVFTKETYPFNPFSEVSKKAIEHTRRTGYETKFGIFKHLSKDKIIYSPHLIVGDENSASQERGFQRAKQNFLKKHSKSKRLNHSSLLKDKSFKDFYEKNKEFEISLSHCVPKEFSWNYNFHIKKENPNEFYPLISFHTHPINHLSCLMPSKADLYVLNELTKTQEGGNINPIMAIAPGTSDFISLPILLIQQNCTFIDKEIEKFYETGFFNYKPSFEDFFKSTGLTGLKNQKNKIKELGYSLGYVYIDTIRRKGCRQNKLEFDIS